MSGQFKAWNGLVFFSISISYLKIHLHIDRPIFLREWTCRRFFLISSHLILSQIRKIWGGESTIWSAIHDGAFCENSLSVIRQKGKSQNGCFRKTKHAKFSEIRTFVTPWYAHVCISGSEMFVFWEIWRALFSWNPRFEINPFAILTTS